MKKIMWKMIKVIMIVTTFGVALMIIPCVLIERKIHAAAYGVVGYGVSLLFAISPRLRQQVQARIRKMLFTQSSLIAAASVAGLIGDRTAAEALAEASSRFRGICLSKLTVEHLTASSCVLDSSLYESSRPCKLGGCDAFI